MVIIIYYNRSSLLVAIGTDLAIVDTTVKSPKTNITNNPASTDVPGRLAIVFGVGIGYITNPVYQDAVVGKSTNYVYIERADHFRSSLSVGFIYSFYKKDPFKGYCIGLFFNPIELGSINATKTSQFDYGIACGYRFEGIAIMLGSDFFTIRQPKRYFINTFKGKDSEYRIDGELQKSIDVNDNSIYRSKMVNSISLKIVIPLATFKKFLLNTKPESASNR